MVCKISISPYAYVIWVMVLLLLPASWWLGVLMASAVHELFHVAAIRLTGGQVTRMYIGPLGAKLETLPMSRHREALCAAAGPLGSLIFAAVLPIYPEAALCAAAQGLYNLLPFYPLDGGRILKCILTDAAYSAVWCSSLILLSGLSLWCACCLHLGVLPVIVMSVTVLRAFERKIPCKETNLAVQ